MKEKKRNTICLLADSGGSKTDWVLLERGRVVQQLKTSGLNPSLVGPERIRGILREEVLPWLAGATVSELRFFGAGLTRKMPRARMRKLLETQLEIEEGFRENIFVEPDILGAGYACLGHRKGLIGILGTGSIAFRFNGKKVSAIKGGLGYLIGDVGGGVALGRVFLRRLVNRDLPEHILQDYPEYSGIKINEVLGTLYSHVAPAQFLAAQVPFLAVHRDDPIISKMIEDQFNGFLEVYLAPLLKKNGMPIIFMGGVARTFEEILMGMCRQIQLDDVQVHKEAPIHALAAFFGRKDDAHS